MARPDASLPEQHGGSWAELKAAYRLLSNPAVAPRAMLKPHVGRTWTTMQDHPTVLVVQDSTELDFSKRATRGSVAGMGPLSGPGHGQGLLGHTALAVDPLTGHVLGLLDQRWWARPEPRAGETRRQRQARWTEADAWADVADALATPGPRPKLVHVGDRGADVWRFFACCRRHGHGFVVRAQHDRLVDHEQLPGGRRLRETLAEQDAQGRRTLKLQRQRKSEGTQTRAPRVAEVSLRFTRVTLGPPSNDPRTADAEPLDVTAIRVYEDDLPEGVKDRERIDWLVLTDRAVDDVEDAWSMIDLYRRRWVIEEFHRCLKQGCRLEASRLDHADDIQRLASIQSVIAVRLLQTRDAAEDPERCDDPAALRAISTLDQRQVVGLWLDRDPDTLTPQEFLLAIAQRGGYLNRNRDPRPGWLVLHRGMKTLRIAVETLQRARPPNCG